MIRDLLTQAISAIAGLALPAASSYAAETDDLLLSLILGTILVLALVFGLMFLFCVKYRHGSKYDRGNEMKKSWRVEIGWTTATLVVFFGLFLWGANLYTRELLIPANTLRVSIVGKQWMWKAEHMGGQREINALHVPVNRPIELVMTSEDVIHDFAIPAFRVKHDVLPGRYTSIWFTPTQTGTYHLFCTQLCGTDHSVMGGEVVVLTAPEFDRWLESNGASVGLEADGKVLFTRFGCSGCHQTEDQRRGAGSVVRAPDLAGVYGHPVPLSDGSVVLADDQYIRDSILEPGKQIVAGYANQMPSFAGVVTEADLARLLAYIKSMAGAS
ncbi:MAG: cytochrome c oxidase subunit II [Acetobacteraceae bacterium]|nr:cytochrome c oxidase subunit II [Acetobacteraceae bacterium]